MTGYIYNIYLYIYLDFYNIYNNGNIYNMYIQEQELETGAQQHNFLIRDLSTAAGDVWEQLGSRKEVEHTWDMQRNTNLEMPGKWKPRLRSHRFN